VAHISLVFREMWDSNAFSSKRSIQLTLAMPLQPPKIVIPPAPARRGTGAEPDFLLSALANVRVCGFLLKKAA